MFNKQCVTQLTDLLKHSDCKTPKISVLAHLNITIARRAEGPDRPAGRAGGLITIIYDNVLY